MEDILLLAYRGHGAVGNKLFALRQAQILVWSVLSRPEDTGEGSTFSLLRKFPKMSGVHAAQDQRNKPVHDQGEEPFDSD